MITKDIEKRLSSLEQKTDPGYKSDMKESIAAIHLEIQKIEDRVSITPGETWEAQLKNVDTAGLDMEIFSEYKKCLAALDYLDGREI